MSQPPEQGWSPPALYRGGARVVEPRTFTEADPMAAPVLLDWANDDPDPPRWSAPTYVGPRRLRPDAGRRRRHSAAAAEASDEPRIAAADLIAADQADAAGADAATTLAPRRPPAAAPDAAPDAAGPEPGTAAGAEPRRERAPGPDSPEAGTGGLMATSRAMAVASLASRITGFLRSSMLVAAIGIVGVGDAYNVANNFPNMVYELLLGGVLSSVLIPLLVHAQEEDDDDGVGYTQRLLSVATAALAVLTLLAVAAAPLLAAGFVADHSQRGLASLFATLLLPEIFFYGLGAMFMAVLNIRHSYAAGAWSPVLNNVVMIVTIAVFWTLPGPRALTPATITTPQILVLGIGTTVGIAAQALVLIPALRGTGFRWQWRFRSRPHEVGRMREVGGLAGWVLGYVIASQVGVTVIARVGVSHHAFTVFTNADLLLQMPYGILVVSLLTALMPRLSRAAARGQSAAVVEDLSLGARLSAVALLPITAALIALGPVLTVVLFGYGETSVAGARLIGTSLAISAFGLFPFAVVMLQLRVFYAMRDARTPTVINVFMVGSKVVLVLVAAATVHTPAHVAEALNTATSASYVVGAVVGHVALTRRLGRLGFGQVAVTVARIGAASLLGGAAAYAVVRGTARWLGTAHVGAVTGLVGGSVVGLAVWAVATWRLRVPEVRDIVALARRR